MIPGRYSQIQAYPTCILYVAQSKRQLIDRPGANYALVSLVAIFPITGAVQTDPPKANYGLVSVVINAAITQSQTDSANAPLALVSCVSILPITQTQTDTPKANLGLVSVFQLTPINATTIVEPPTGAFRLVFNS